MVKKSLPVLNIILLLLFLWLPLSAQALNGQAEKWKKKSQWTQIRLDSLNALVDGDNRKVIELTEKAYQYAKKNLGEDHPDTLTSMHDLATLYKSLGRYSESETLYKKTLQLRKKVLGKEHPDTLIAMNNLSAFYESRGRYGEAEPFFKKTLQLRKKVLGREHPSTLISMNALALLYKSLGRYSEAEPLYKKTLQLREKVLGKEHRSTLNSMNNLAVLYNSQGRYGEAEPLFKEALQLLIKVRRHEYHLEEGVDTLAAMNIALMSNRALLYQSQDRYGEAEPLFKKALQLSEKVLGKKHPDTLTIMVNLAAFYNSQGRYGEAEPLFKKALQLSEKVLGKEHPDTLLTQIKYIWLMVNMKKARMALRHFKQTENRLLSRSFQELYSISTERIRRLYLKTLSGFQDAVFSFAAADPQIAHQQYAANVILRWKQVYAQESAYQHRFLHTSRDPLIEKVNRLRASFSRQVHSPNTDVDLEVMWNELNLTEQKIREKAKKLKPDLDVSSADMDQVLGRLPKDSTLIEFKMYRQVNFKTFKLGEIRLAACLLTSDREAEQSVYFKNLGTVKELTKSLDPSGREKRTAYGFLLGKFDQQIKKAKTLYVAPDGFLNLISFAALRLAGGRYLVQRQRIKRVQTGRDFLALPGKSPANELIAFGGVDYGELSADIKTEMTNSGDPSKQLNMRAAGQLRGLSYLKYSSFEASSIAEIFKTHRKDGKTTVYKKYQATEHRLKNLEQPPRILHLSTHGFYLQDAELSQWTEEAPLLLSGLALAGANHGLKGMVDKHGDDGLLYSMEVLGLNLQGTELVSLSACDTGKGVIDYSEGVYGLVRSFRTAGAQNVLMTLRPVGDRSARDFMDQFYDFWLGAVDDIEPAEALHQARLYFISHPNKEYREPSIWSPYVMVGK